MISARATGSASSPREAMVTVELSVWRGPRVVTQPCTASSTTSTPRGVEAGLQRVGDLLGQPLLQLRPGGEGLDDRGQCARGPTMRSPGR